MCRDTFAVARPKITGAAPEVVSQVKTAAAPSSDVKLDRNWHKQDCALMASAHAEHPVMGSARMSTSESCACRGTFWRAILSARLDKRCSRAATEDMSAECSMQLITGTIPVRPDDRRALETSLRH